MNASWFCSEASAAATDILENNILPFWKNHSPDGRNGGYFGYIDNHNNPREKHDKGLVMTARLVWSFSALYNRYKKEWFAKAADQGLDFLLEFLYDKEYGGFFWTCNYKGSPIETHKQIYGQAFCLYAFSEYLAGRENSRLRELSTELYELLETKSKDVEYGGYYEACERNWTPKESHALSKTDIACSKSMNTHLHVLEAYTAYLRINPDNTELRIATRELIQCHFQKIVDPTSGHFSLYFDKDWTRKDSIHSFGHDIEGSWLIWEAIEELADEDFAKIYRQRIINLLDVALEGCETSGDNLCMINERNGDHLDRRRIWWVQAEAAVGLVNGWQMTGKIEYLEKAASVMDHIEKNQLCPDGEWYWALDAKNQPVENTEKAGLWKTPYHNTRFCLEIIRKCGQITP